MKVYPFCKRKYIGYEAGGRHSWSEVSLRTNGQSIRHKPILFSSYIGCAPPSHPPPAAVLSYRVGTFTVITLVLIVDIYKKKLRINKYKKMERK